MNVLITGANSQLGMALQRVAPSWVDVNGIDVEDCDLADRSMLTARLIVEAPDLIINTAAYNVPDDANWDEAVAQAVNVEAVAVMVEAMSSHGGKVVHLSTDQVFDPTNQTHYFPDAIRAPSSAYGRTKAAGEDALRPHDLLVRTAWVYDAREGGVVRTIIDLINERAEIAIVRKPIGAPTWANGLARTIWALIEKGATGTFHSTDAGCADSIEFAAAVAEESHMLGLVKHFAVINEATANESGIMGVCRDFAVLDCSDTGVFLGEQPPDWRSNLQQMLREMDIT